jgi:acyl carrier protein
LTIAQQCIIWRDTHFDKENASAIALRDFSGGACRDGELGCLPAETGGQCWSAVSLGRKETVLADSAAVFDQVKEIVVERLGVEDDKVTMEAEFIADLNADSLDIVGVISDLEDKFSLTINDTDANSIRTVGDAVELIAERSA